MMLRLLAVLFLFTSTPLAAATVTARVKAEGTGTALASMVVEAWTLTGTMAARSTTTSSGTASLTLNAGSYRVLAYDPLGNYATSFYFGAESFDTSTTVSLTATQSVTLDLSMQRAAWIIGSVRTMDNAPVPFAIVAVYNPSGTLRGRTVADASGAYRQVVPAGSYKVAAWDEAGLYRVRFNGGALSFASAALISLGTSATLTANFNLPPASYFTGTVTNHVTGAPLAGMRVQAWDANGFLVGSQTTDASGFYRISVEPGSYRLVFFDPAGLYAPAYFGNATSFASSPLLTVGVSETRASMDAALVLGARIMGRVADRNSGAPLPGITVSAWNDDGTARTFLKTGATGDYILVVPPGTYRIGAHDDSLVYASQFHADTLLFSAATRITVFAGDQRVVDFAMSLPGRFTGRVTSAVSGASLTGVTVAAYDSAGRLIATTMSAPDGTYVLAVLPGQYHLAAWDAKDRFTVGHRDAAVAVAAEAVVDFNLVPKSRNRSVRH